MKNKGINKKTVYFLIACLMILVSSVALCGCGNAHTEPVEVEVKESSTTTVRSSKPVCLIPEAGGDVIGNEEIEIDKANSKEGYFYIKYHGASDDVKMQISCGDGITYTYKVCAGDTVVPLTQGDGLYNIVVYEGMGNGQYATVFADTTQVNITNEFGPFLYPNYYVDFDENTEAVAIGEGLASNCTCDLEVIGAVYDYVIENISYDHEEALNVASDYVPDVDEILETKKGICFDYASLMAAMLRSQRIPTRLEIGYAGDAYHAWVTTYVEDIGWINGIIQFDGTQWTLMDPTFAANADAKTLKEFVGSGDNYTTKYEY